MIRWPTAQPCSTYCTEASSTPEKSAVRSGWRVSSLRELLRGKALVLQCACASLWTQSGGGESWATQLAVICLFTQVSYINNHPCFSYTPSLSVFSLLHCYCQVENGRCADEKLTGCWESGEEVRGTTERGGHGSSWYHCHPDLARTNKGESYINKLSLLVLCSLALILIYLS